MLFIACCIIPEHANADTFYPDHGTMQPDGTTAPYMPIWWPTWFPFEEPPTPVPPVPTDWQIYQAQLTRILQIDAEIDDIETEIELMELLLRLDPNGVNAPMIQMQLDMLRMSKAALEAERQQLRNQMIAP